MLLTNIQDNISRVIILNQVQSYIADFTIFARRCSCLKDVYVSCSIFQNGTGDFCLHNMQPKESVGKCSENTASITVYTKLFTNNVQQIGCSIKGSWCLYSWDRAFLCSHRYLFISLRPLHLSGLSPVLLSARPSASFLPRITAYSYPVGNGLISMIVYLSDIR